MFRHWSLIWRNSIRNRRRSVLTIASIAASLCLLGVLMAMYQALYLSDAPPEQALRLVTRNKVSLTFPLPISYRQTIQRIGGVREVMSSSWFGGVWKEPKFFFARFAVDAEKLFVIHPEYQLPAEQKVAFQRERTACLVGRGLADKYGFNVGDRITLKGDIYPVNMELTVRGIYDDRLNNEVLYFHREYLAESLPPARRDLVGTFNVLADAPASVPRIADEVDALFRNSTTQTRTETEQAFQLGFVSFLGNVKMFLLSISAAVTFTILLVSGNTMAMSVRERVREVGILKTLGFTPAAILGIILGEAVCIALIGGAVGAGLAALLCGVVRSGPAFLTQLKALTISGPVFGLCLLTAALIGLVSAAVPAWRASRTPILESLRFTG